VLIVVVGKSGCWLGSRCSGCLLGLSTERAPASKTANYLGSAAASPGFWGAGAATMPPVASMSMADSKASSSTGPYSKMACPVWRSSTRSDGVAVTPLFVASAAWVRMATSARLLAMHCSMADMDSG